MEVAQGSQRRPEFRYRGGRLRYSGQTLSWLSGYDGLTPGVLVQLWSCAVNRRVFAEPAPEQQPGKQEAGRLQEKQLDLVGAA